MHNILITMQKYYLPCGKILKMKIFFIKAELYMDVENKVKILENFLQRKKNI